MALLLVDNLSPFTPDIVDRLKELDVSFKHATYRDAIPEGLPHCDRVILSGRRRNCKEINAANSKIVRHCHESGKPLLGICYGAEIIALTFGGSIRRMPSHVQGHSMIKVKESNALTLGKETISVYESHAYCVARL
ncbi:MAG: gamma-glutamyl-gamma-aminobutyrate hydrolase family protein, partial [Nitrososphaera sp.]|nr:gamma-glutamyl-gamma-aminobutyrate hydrolase family protein [Nitrososphaera sp.]